MAITLKAARVNKGYSQNVAAKLLNVTTTTLRNWEKAKTFPTVPQIKDIENVYEVSYNDIIFCPKITSQS